MKAFVSLSTTLSQKSQRLAAKNAARAWSGNIRLLLACDESRSRTMGRPFAGNAATRLNRLVLQSLMSVKSAPQYLKASWRNELEMLGSNAVGSRANDFKVFLNTRRSLFIHGLFKNTGGLVCFYDPECDDCAQGLAILTSQYDQLRKRIPLVLLVYAGGNELEWRKSMPKELPRGWLVGRDDGTVVSQSLYDLRRLPSFYVLRAGAIVAYRTCSINDLMAYLASEIKD